MDIYIYDYKLLYIYIYMHTYMAADYAPFATAKNTYVYAQQKKHHGDMEI